MMFKNPTRSSFIHFCAKSDTFPRSAEKECMISSPIRKILLKISFHFKQMKKNYFKYMIELIKEELSK